MSRATIYNIFCARILMALVIVGVAITVVFVHPLYAAVRVKEIAQFEGARENQLMGYGIVVGLDGTGDKGSSSFTTNAMVSMLERLGIKLKSSDISVKNVAAVMLTASLPPFVRMGQKLT